MWRGVTVRAGRRVATIPPEAPRPGLDPRFLSWSGNERNHLFLNAGGRQFHDVGGISGLDHSGDSRVYGLFDYDRDGFQDVVMVNANAPFVQLFRNRIGDLLRSKGSGGVIGLRFEGGNHTSSASQSWSNRDGIGARVTVGLGETTLTREHSAGEGLASQHSATMLIGIGSHGEAETIEIRWPSGRLQTLHDVVEGSLVTLYENPAHSASGQGFETAPYRLDLRLPESDSRLDVGARTPTLAPRAAARRFDAGDLGQEDSTLRVYTSMATWCSACKRDLPQIALLRSVFGAGELALIGVPVDPEDDEAKLGRYLEANRPAFELLREPSPLALETQKRTVVEELGYEGIPASIVTDGEGVVLRVLWGVPSVSLVKALLASLNEV